MRIRSVKLAKIEHVQWKILVLVVHNPRVHSLYSSILQLCFPIHRYRRKLNEHSLSNLSLARPLIQWYHKFRNEEDGANSWFETLSCGEIEYLECEKSQLWTWKSGGYATVFDLLMVRCSLIHS